MKITDKEKTEIFNFLKANKPLPNKYKFLLFEETDDVEISWLGKHYEKSNVSLPFQYIEHVDTPRSEDSVKLQADLFDFSGRKIKGWCNKLIWGDNKLVLSSLINGPMFDEIKEQGGIKLVYIDPPFDTQADFNFKIDLPNDSDKSFIKKSNIIEEVAYRDTWGKGVNSFNQMLYERLNLIKDLLADDGSIYVHCDWRVNSGIRLILNEIFGKENFRNEIIWWYKDPSGKATNAFKKKHDSILFYAKSKNNLFNLDDVREEYSKGTLEQSKRGSISFGRVTKVNPLGKIPVDVWDVPIINSQAHERLGYPTQKPEKLLEKIIKASSNEGDLVADFFCGSGTTLAIAEKLNRKWVGVDIGKFAIHTSRKRLLNSQRELKKNSKDFRPFEVLNLGKYERQYYVKMFDINKKNSKIVEKIKFDDFKDMVLEAYGARKTSGSNFFDGIKNNSLIYIGPVDYPTTRQDVEKVIEESKNLKISSVDILAFEYEMGIFPAMRDEAKKEGVSIEPKRVPQDIFDKRAIENGDLKFYDISYIDVKINYKKNEFSVELLKYIPNYSQDNLNETLKNFKDNQKRIIVENSNVIAITKRDGKFSRESLIKHWLDWIDYWSVDFDYESRPEIIRKKKGDKIVLEPTGNFIFENEWQDYRYNGSKILHKTPFYPLTKSSVKIAIRVIDIFANDTMIVKEVKR